MNKLTDKKRSIKIVITIAIVATLSAMAFFTYQTIPFSLDSVEGSAFKIIHYFKSNPAVGTLIFIGIYFIANSVPMPFISLLTILAGYLFGTVKALSIVSFISALGASCLFLISRYFLKEWVETFLQKRAPFLVNQKPAQLFNYALSLRLMPGMPFCVPSIALSFTTISLARFYLSTQLGLLFILFVFVNAGSQLTQFQTINDLFSLQLIISMLLLAIAPLLLSRLSKRFLTTKS